MKKIIFLILIISTFYLLSCSHSSPYKNAEKLCTDFYKINKENKYDILYDIYMGDRIGIDYNKNNDIHVTFNGVRFQNNYCFIFDSLASIKQQKQIFITKVSSETKAMLMKWYKLDTNDVDTFKVYQRTVLKFYKEYNQIKIPKEIPYRNILIYSNFKDPCIKFLLYVNHTDEKHYWGLVVYHFSNDSLLLKQYWLNRIEKIKSKKISIKTDLDSITSQMNYWSNQRKLLKKIDENWYYEENVPLHDGHP